MVNQDLYAKTTAAQWVAVGVLFTAVIALLVLLVPPALGPLLFLTLCAVIIGSIGPEIGFHRHAAVLVFVPMLGQIVAFTAAWRTCSLPINRYWTNRLWPYALGGRIAPWQLLVAAVGFILTTTTTVAALA